MAQGYSLGRSSKTAVHITTSTTTTPISTDCYLSSISISVSNAGTTWAFKVQNKEGTPKIFYINSSVTVGTVIYSFVEPILMTGGIDIITTGASPGVVDVFLTTLA